MVTQNNKRRRRRTDIINTFLTLGFTLISAGYLYPLVLMVVNSFKKKAYISRAPFTVPLPWNEEVWDKMFVGGANYITGIKKTVFPWAFVYSLVITVLSVAVILLLCSMTAWYISRVTSGLSLTVLGLCLFSMVVPFQMVMFTLSKISNALRLNTPLGIVIVYLGFGAGLAVFMFAGYMRTCPVSVEESAMIDGCNPLRTFFFIVMPILKPIYVSTGILEAMWIWNDYLLPYLVLDLKRFKTIPIAVQYLKGGYGSVDMGAMMAILVLAIIPIVVLYLFCQRYIITGVMSGAVKG